MQNRTCRPSYLEYCIRNHKLDTSLGTLHTYPRTLPSPGSSFGQIVDLTVSQTRSIPEPHLNTQYLGLLKGSLILTLSRPSKVNSLVKCYQMLPEVDWLSEVNVSCRACMSFYIPSRYWEPFGFKRENYRLEGTFFTLPLETGKRTWNPDKNNTSYQTLTALYLSPPLSTLPVNSLDCEGQKGDEVCEA